MTARAPETAPPAAPAIRVATPDDAESIRAMYAPCVRETAVTFEYDVPSVREMRQRPPGP